MSSERFELTAELLQRYYDGELEQAESREVEQALADDPAAAATLEDYRTVGRMLRQAAADAAPDELASRRTWDAISSEFSPAAGRSAIRRPAAWLAGVAAAAALALYLSPFDIVPAARASNELDIESIDCSYHSFMLLQPETENGHTIIWINDSGGGQ